MLLLDNALADWSGPTPWPPVTIAVNVSPRSLRDPDFPERIADVLRFHDASPSMLMLEITENLILSDAPRATVCLTRLHELGVKLAIDDFGVGYSSLSRLRRLPVDQLKIDMSFVHGLEASNDAIVRSTIALAHDLGLTVVAEGVEGAIALEHLRELECDAVQGMFVARPGSATTIRRWLARQHVGTRES
jgi:EAL domain-containing protein (putative c-di-GMP-specific phosphodiesterase class I)